MLHSLRVIATMRHQCDGILHCWPAAPGRCTQTEAVPTVPGLTSLQCTEQQHWHELLLRNKLLIPYFYSHVSVFPFVCWTKSRPLTNIFQIVIIDNAIYLLIDLFIFLFTSTRYNRLFAFTNRTVQRWEEMYWRERWVGFGNDYRWDSNLCPRGHPQGLCRYEHSSQSHLRTPAYSLTTYLFIHSRLLISLSPGM